MSNQTRPVVLVCQPLLFQKMGVYREILERGGFEVRFPQFGGRVLSEAELASDIGGVAATIASTEPYTASILNQAKNLRVISRTGVGYDSIDVSTATDRNVVVACTPGTNQDAVAEHAFALLLAVTKRIVKCHTDVAAGSFRRQVTGSLRGKSLGIIGLGRIGRAVARRANAFDMRVIAYDPLVSRLPDDAPTVELVELSDLLARSDIISLNAAATDETTRLIRKETLAQMKPGVILINTARGTLIDEPALAEALESGHVSGAGLDVFQNEPPNGSPLLSAPNVVLSPHIAGLDEQSIEDMSAMAAQTIVDLYQGCWPEDRVINAKKLTQPWRWG